MADRTEQLNRTISAVVHEQIPDTNGLVFITEPFTTVMELSGSITGYFMMEVNKKDIDFGFNYYAIDKDGTVSYLNTYRSRASHANSETERKLLKPHRKIKIPIVNARMTAKLLEEGSRLAIVVSVNKNQETQVNHGSGMPVNLETSDNAGAPLVLTLHNDSEIRIPIKPYKG